LPTELEKHLAGRIAGRAPAARRAIYDEVRAGLQSEVRAAAPFMPVQTVVARRRELENAIIAVEREAARADPARPIEPAPQDPALLAAVMGAKAQASAPANAPETVAAESETDSATHALDGTHEEKFAEADHSPSGEFAVSVPDETVEPSPSLADNAETEFASGASGCLNSNVA
jgi:hypothetical protein